MTNFPSAATLVALSADYNRQTLPRRWQLVRVLDRNRWAKVCVLQGLLDVEIDGKRVRVRPDLAQAVPAGATFRVIWCSRDIRFRLQYFVRRPTETLSLGA